MVTTTLTKIIMVTMCSGGGYTTPQFDGGTFESAISPNALTRRTPFSLTKQISKVVFKGGGTILPAPKMDSLFTSKPPEFMASVGASLNVAVDDLADVLHTFFLNVCRKR